MNATAAASAQSQSFATYLARSYIAKKGFKADTVPEAAELKGASDFVLTRADMSFQILCIVDREANPGKKFALSRDALVRIGKGCLKYSGKVNGARMPVVIHIIEVGPGPVAKADQKRLKIYKRPHLFSKVHIAAWSLDTARRSVWSNAWLNGLLIGRRFHETLLRTPRASDAELAPKPEIVLRRERFPLVTGALLALLVGVFTLEQKFAVAPGSALWTPSIRTLVALGGLNSDLVLQHGQWWRLLSATVLHGGLLHLVFNSIALYMAGRVLETLVGRVWFLALFVVGALGGSVLSLAINPPNLVSVGASGAIMGLLAGAFVSSFRLSMGAQRTQIQMSMLQVLIPGLIPLATAGTGHKIDFAAHLGGAIMGAIVGLALLKNWRPENALPGLAKAAAAIAAVGVAAYAFAAVSVGQQYPMHLLGAHLIPKSELPATSEEAIAKSEAFLAKYPRDPRVHMWRAAALINTNDLERAELELRAALKDDDVLQHMFAPDFKLRLQGMLAVVLKDRQREAEAVAMAVAPCGPASSIDLRKSLDSLGLCK